MTKSINSVILENKLALLRKKWLQAKKDEDLVMMSVIEKQAKALKIGAGMEK